MLFGVFLMSKQNSLISAKVFVEIVKKTSSRSVIALAESKVDLLQSGSTASITDEEVNEFLLENPKILLYRKVSAKTG